MSRTAHSSAGSESGCGTGIVDDMTSHDKSPMFDGRIREQLYRQRVLVLDGPLDDDNGTVLATQLLALAAEDPQQDIALWIHSPGGSVPSMLAIRDVWFTAEQAREYGFIDHIVTDLAQVVPIRQREFGLVREGVRA